MSIRLRHVADINPYTPDFDHLDENAEIPFVPLEAIWPDHRFDTNRRRLKREVSNGYTRFADGDILLPKITPTFQANRTVIATAIDGGIGTATTEVHVIRVSNVADTKYIRHLFSSKRFLEEGEAAMVGVAGQKRVPDNYLRDLQIPIANQETQCVIAEYLDAKTSQIDALIDKKKQMIRTLRQRWQALVSTILCHNPGIRLKHLLRAPLAYGVLVPEDDPGGVPMLRIMDLSSSGVDLDSVARIPPTLSARYHRTVLAEGDLVVSVVGTLGRSVHIGPGLAGCNINRALARVQLRPAIPHNLIRFWFESDQFRGLAQIATSGDSAQATLGLGDLKNFMIGLPSDPHQWHAMDDELTLRQTDIQDSIDALERQSTGLVEHRQALITAAVAGEFAIPGAPA